MKRIFLLFFVSISVFSQNNEEKQNNPDLISVEHGKEIPDNEVSIALIDEVPTFPGCEEKDKKELLKCFNKKIIEHITEHFRYPRLADKQNVEGKVSVTFLVDKEGNVTNIRAHGHELLTEEAIRIISLLPKMSPGKQNGKPVKVRYGLPITFRLTK